MIFLITCGVKLTKYNLLLARIWTSYFGNNLRIGGAFSLSIDL